MKEIMKFEPDWIPFSTEAELPEEGQRCWLSFTTKYTSYVKDAWWRDGKFIWSNGHVAVDTPMAWKPYLVPKPYQCRL